MSLTVDDFDFPLPPELIAQHPAAERTGSRLLHVCGAQHVDRRFADLPTQLKAGDLLVFNDTRVIKARFFGLKESGGKVEIKDTGSALVFLIDATADLSTHTPPITPSPSWLASTLNLAQGFRKGPAAGGTHFEFWYARPNSMVA